MAYDENLATRVRTSLGRRRGISEKKMFGGLSFLLDGKMCCGIVGDKLVVRLGEDQSREALDRSYTAPMTFTGRAMKSMVYVLPGGTRNRKALDRWVSLAVDFTRSVPAKKASRSARKK